MKRINIFNLLLESLFLVVFNLLFFALGDTSTFKTAVWISYGFIHFAYFTLLCTPLFVRKSSEAHIYRRPLYLITACYFIIELITGVTLILIAPETVKATIIIQMILATIFGGLLLVNLITNEHTANNAKY
jgi:L-asparagine transporter-like permease